MKKLFGNKKTERYLSEIKKKLKEKNACYVLITCSHPSKEGKMDVELDFDGDEVLASYLVDGAQNVFQGDN